MQIKQRVVHAAAQPRHIANEAPQASGGGDDWKRRLATGGAIGGAVAGGVVLGVIDIAMNGSLAGAAIGCIGGAVLVGGAGLGVGALLDLI